MRPSAAYGACSRRCLTTLEQASRLTPLSPTDLVALMCDAVGEHRLAFDSHQFVVDAEPTNIWALVDGARIRAAA